MSGFFDGVMRLFGGGASAAARRQPPLQRVAVVDLTETRFNVAQTAEDLLVRVRRQKKEVRALKRSGQRAAAKIRLAASKQTEGRVEHCHRILVALDSVIEVQEMARINHLSVDSLRAASKMLRDTLTTLDADAVADVQADLDSIVREANEVQRETGRAVPALRGPVLDDLALEEELDAMINTSSEEEEEEELKSEEPEEVPEKETPSPIALFS